MSLFEDVVEVQYQSENRIEGPRNIDTLREGLRKIAASPDKVSIILDWDTLDKIAYPLDVEPEVTGHVPRDHVELRPDKIGLALETRAFVHGIETSQPLGLLMDPSAVRYSNSIINEKKVVAIEWTDAR
jgi:hypothetical protein